MLESVVIVVFAAMQSVFGIGILFFGTPTLVLLGYSFTETLAVVLPPSATVSLLQLVQGKLPQPHWQKSFSIWCLTPLAVVLGATLWWQWHIDLEFLVSCTLSIYVLIRVIPKLHYRLRKSVQDKEKIWFIAVGTVHGLSNLGGGLLAIFSANKFKDKLEIRSFIAFCYLCFATIQLLVLVIMKSDVMGWMQFIYAAIGGAVFVVCERKIFGAITLPTFDRAFTALIGVYSILVMLKYFGALQVTMRTQS